MDTPPVKPEERRSASRVEGAPAYAVGYTHKPLWVYLAGSLMMLAPVGNYLFALRAAGIESWAAPQTWVGWLSEIDPWAGVLMALVFVSGLGLFAVQRWSWALASFSLLATVVYNLLFLRKLLWLGGLNVAAMCALSAGALWFLYLGWFRRPYLDPRVRWWETSPRRKTHLPVSIRGLGVKGSLLDLSRTGALVQWDDLGNFEIPPSFLVRMPGDFQVKCETVRKTERGAGLRFVETDPLIRAKLDDLLKRLRR